jgi:5'-3' exoribonuclease 2
MGVPAFYRWLRDKYPKCIEDVVEDAPATVDGVEVPVSFRGPNPNGFEVDNLYLDMNGIIHPCVHPEDVPAPTSEEEMFLAITAYIDRLVYAVRPRKVLFMAIDGVAPRAKMNQQRSRRFKAAQDMAEEEEVEEELRAALRARGQKLPPKRKPTFDHNVITPGTRFMDRLAIHLRYYIADRLSNNGDWRGLRVVLSDASVPGEGEHKIMEYVRQQRAQPGYHPNTHHVLHGLDADLIMLGLATHEAHFTICREDVLGKSDKGAGGGNKCHTCGREGHRADQCTGYVPPPKEAPAPAANTPGAVARPDADSLTSIASLIARKPLHFLHLSTLREYLGLEFTPLAPSLPFGFDLERVIDDFVFMCFFVGNDFLPHLPSLDIREGAIDLLLGLYRQLLPGLGGYLTEEGSVHLPRVDVLLGRVGAVEDEIFRRRRSKEDKDKGFDDRRRAERAAATAAGAGREDLPDDARAVVAALDVGIQAIAQRSTADVVEAKVRHIAVAGTAEAEAEAAQRRSSRTAAGRGASAPAAAAVSASSSAAAVVTTEVTVTAGARPAVAPSTADNKGAAAALRAKLLGLPVPAAAADADAAQPRAGQKRGRDEGGESGADASEAPAAAAATGDAGGVPSKLAAVEAYDAATGGAIAIAVPVTAAGASGDAAPEPTPSGGSGDSDADALNVDDLFSAPLGADEVAAVQAAEVAGAVAAAAAADAVVAAAGGDADGAAAADAHTLAPGAASASVSGMLKASVMKALLAKRTRESVEDGVRFGTSGWKDRYYTAKFGHEAASDAGFRGRVYKHYVEGLVWVFKYYYSGVASWKWFYPFHYAPFASDLRGLDGLAIEFELGRPFRPLDQLMGVLPPRSSHALPPACAALMTPDAAASPISDFYPSKFAMDPNGKKFTWQWVVLLPFIDEARLVAAVDRVAATLSAEERRRNAWGHEMLFTHQSTAMGRLLAPLMPPLVEGAPADGGGDDGGDVGDPTEEPAAAATTTDGGDVAASSSSSGKAVAEFGGSLTDIVPVASSATAVHLTPRDGDEAGKGFTATCVSLRDGRAGLRGVRAVPLGGTFLSPWAPVLPHIERCSAVTVSLLPPPRRKHACHLLPGAEPPAAVLEPADDDPSGRVPRLTRGMNIADLAWAGAGGGGGGRRGGGGGEWGGGGGGYQQQPRRDNAPLVTYAQAHAQHYQQQPQPQQQGQQQYGGPPPASFGYGGGGGGGGGRQQYQQQQQQPMAPPPASFGYGGGMPLQQQPMGGGMMGGGMPMGGMMMPPGGGMGGMGGMGGPMMGMPGMMMPGMPGMGMPGMGMGGMMMPPIVGQQLPMGMGMGGMGMPLGGGMMMQPPMLGGGMGMGGMPGGGMMGAMGMPGMPGGMGMMMPLQQPPFGGGMGGGGFQQPQPPQQQQQQRHSFRPGGR